MTQKKKITVKAFCRLFRCRQSDVPNGFQERTATITTNYGTAIKTDIERYVLKILEKINSFFIRRNRKENLAAWEKGWNENLEDFQKDLSEEHLKPKYFSPGRFFRYNKTIIIPENPNLEYDLFAVVRYFLFNKYFENYDTLYELGCGSCQNILMLSGLFPDKKYVGLDWSNASRKIASLVAKKNNVNVKGYVFDMLNPTNDLKIEKGSLIYSIHALEQLGKNHGRLISFILDQKPALVIHYEPIAEFYDRRNLYDYLALMYSTKRDYLSGYLTALRELDKNGMIKIIEEYRPYIGGVYHESSLIVWKPL